MRSIELLREEMKRKGALLYELKQRVENSDRKPTPEEIKYARGLADDIEAEDYEIRLIESEEILTKPQRPGIRPDVGNRSSSGLPQYGTANFSGPIPKRYKELFPKSNLSNDGFKCFRDFFYTVVSGQPDVNLRAMSESVPSEGGFIIPSEYSRELFDVALESEIVRPRATVYPMASNERHIPATTLGDHSSNLYGGVICYWKPEAGTLTSAQPAFREMTLTAKKLTAFGVASNELAEDGINFEQSIGRIFPKAIGWYLDKAFLTGSGAGQPLGILDAACTVAIGRSTASNIKYADVCNMVSRLHPACFPNSVWVASVTAIPQLLQLVIGTTGYTHYPVMTETNGQYSMLSRPVIFSEKLPALGTKGDLLLADFSQYAIGLRKEARLDRSEHLYFDKDQVAYRCTLRGDGQALWNSTLTLADGSTTVGPFVVLNA